MWIMDIEIINDTEINTKIKTHPCDNCKEPQLTKLDLKNHMKSCSKIKEEITIEEDQNKDEKGNYKRVSPNDHVNYGQSTNDVIPTAIRIGGLLALEHSLYPALSGAIAALDNKADEFQDIVKSGRTHNQDAVPVRLGESFRAWAQILGDHLNRIERASEDLMVLGLGGSATGTGLNTHPQYLIHDHPF